MKYITNKGEGTAVVLVHGNSLSNGIWQPLLDDPGLKDLRLVAVDLPGHGKSPRHPESEPYSLDGYANVVADLVRTLPDPVLVGHSLGGHICIRALAKAPNARGLMLMGAPPMTSAADMARAFLHTPAMANAFKPDLSMDDARTSAEVYTWPGSPWIDPMADMIMNADPRVRSDLGRELMSGQWDDEHALIRRSGVPVCMVHGQDEPSIALEYLNGIAELFWQQRVHVVEGCGHSAQLQRPEVFNVLLRTFINAL